MSEDQTPKPAPDPTETPAEAAELTEEDLKKVSGGIAETFQAHFTGLKVGGGVDESAPTWTEPGPSPKPRNITHQ